MGRSPTRNVPGKRLRVQAQRKFASGTALPVAPPPCTAPPPLAAALSPPTSANREKACNNRRPTEDVLTFLCYKDEAHNLKDFDRFNSYNIMYPRNQVAPPPAAVPSTSSSGIQTRKRGAVMTPDPPSPVKKRAIRRPPDLVAAPKVSEAAPRGTLDIRKASPATGPSTRRSLTRGKSSGEANRKPSLRSSDSRRSSRKSELEVSPKIKKPPTTTMQTRKRGAVKPPASNTATPPKRKSPKKFAQPVQGTSSVTRNVKDKRRVTSALPAPPAHGSRTRRTLMPSAARLPPYFIPYGVRKQASVTPSRAPNRAMLSAASSTSTNTPPSTPGGTPTLSSPSTPAPSSSEPLGLISLVPGNSLSTQISTITVNSVVSPASTIVQTAVTTSTTFAKTPASTAAKICTVVLAPTPSSYLAESPKPEPTPVFTHELLLRAPTRALTSAVTRTLTRAPNSIAIPSPNNGVTSAVICDTTSAVICDTTSAVISGTTSYTTYGTTSTVTCVTNSLAICGTTTTVTNSTLVAVLAPTHAPASATTSSPTAFVNCAPTSAVTRPPASAATRAAISAVTRVPTSVLTHVPTSVAAYAPIITMASISTRTPFSVAIRTPTRTSTSSITPASTPVEAPAPISALSSITNVPTSAGTRAPTSIVTRAPTSAATRNSSGTRTMTSAPNTAQTQVLQPRQSTRSRSVVINDPNQQRNMSSDDEPLSKVNKGKMSSPLRYPSFAKKEAEKPQQEQSVVNVTVHSKTSCSSETDYTDSDEEPLAKKKTKKKIPNSQRKRLSIPTLLTSRSLLQASKSKLALESLHRTIPGLLPKEEIERGSGSSLEAKEIEGLAKKKFTKNISYIEKWIEDSKNASCPLDFPGERPIDHSEAIDARVYEFNSECESQKSYKRKKKIQELKKDIPDGPRHLFYIPLTGSEHVIQGVEVKMDSHDGSQQRTIMRAKLVTNADTERDMQSALVDTKDVAGDATAHCPAELQAEPVAHCSKQLPSRRKAGGSDNKSDEVSKVQARPLSPNEAPIFRPTQKQFKNPLKYIEGIAESANKFGLCRIIPPTSKGASNECNFSEDMRFTPNYQYVHRMMNRWGPCSRSMCAIRKNLQNQGGSLESIPKLNGIEVDLPKLYIVVEEMGGLEQVLEKKLWLKVAENMGFIVSTPSIGVRLQEVYWRYILPYYTLSEVERESLLNKVDKMWSCRYERIRARAAGRGEGEEEEEMASAASADPTEDLEECVTRGSSTTLGAFSKLAKHIQCMYFNRQPHPDKAADMFWKYVINRDDHVCVSTGSIDSGSMNYGFPSPKDKKSQWAKIPWNLKVLTNNSGNILRSLGPTIGVTVPTVHVGMLFSCCCWCQDPHGLPWIDYHHQGAPKVWYGVPSSHQAQMQAALGRVKPEIVETKKRVWLLSDTIMVPPGQLISDNVAVTRTVQLPGEIVVVSPGAFTSNLCTGFSISENVYFASIPWLQQAPLNFNAIYESREPSMFSFERLVIALAKERSTLPFLNTLLGILEVMVDEEVKGRKALAAFGIQGSTKPPMPPSRRRAAQYNQDNEECHRCRKILTMSEVSHTEDKTLYCLSHAAELLRGQPVLASRCKLNFTYSEAQLNILLDSVRLRASASTPAAPGNQPECKV